MVLVLWGSGGFLQTDIPKVYYRCRPGLPGTVSRKSQFSSPIFQCGKEFTAPGECHIPALQLLPAPSPSRPQLTQPVPRGNSSVASVLTAGPLSRLLGAFWLLPLIPGECWQPKVSVSSSECRWGRRSPRVLFREAADTGRW